MYRAVWFISTLILLASNVFSMDSLLLWSMYSTYLIENMMQSWLKNSTKQRIRNETYLTGVHFEIMVTNLPILQVHAIQFVETTISWHSRKCAKLVSMSIHRWVSLRYVLKFIRTPFVMVMVFFSRKPTILCYNEVLYLHHVFR